MSYGDVNMPLLGSEMGNKELNVYSPGKGIVIESGVIAEIGESDELATEFVPSWISGNGSFDGINVIDAANRAIIPGFVDSHTHLLWGGDRSNEIGHRQRGMTYAQISEAGGGINKTVTETRKCTVEELVTMGKNRLSEARALGTTTIEVKSGYGLSVDSELRLLKAYGRISEESSMDIHTTWLGAHDFPKGMKRSEYMEEIITEQMPLIAEQGISRWVDVFCEPGWFDTEQTELIVVAAKGLGLTPRLHVDEFVDSGGLSLASELGSVSADHVAHSNDESREMASKSGTMQTFLPGTPYVMGSNEYPPIRKCLENKWAFSLATDFNPNCNSISIPFTGSLAAHRCGIDPISALAAVTRNPSTTLGYGDKVPVGSISVGMDADMNILKGPEVEMWCQTPGMNPISSTIIKGIL
jgi:imidazolonepropionase|tara:strand:+ start:4166 stop:5404 length:1239 start_codon:yes stop_codon:yes gene_type:complete